MPDSFPLSRLLAVQHWLVAIWLRALVALGTTTRALWRGPASRLSSRTAPVQHGEFIGNGTTMAPFTLPGSTSHRSESGDTSGGCISIRLDAAVPDEALQGKPPLSITSSHYGEAIEPHSMSTDVNLISELFCATC